MKFHALRIVAKSPMGVDLWLDDLKLMGVIDYRLTGDVSDPNRLELTLYVGSVNADNELLKKLLEEK